MSNFSNEARAANRQWASRPADERFTSPEALIEACEASKMRSLQRAGTSRQLEFHTTDDLANGLRVNGGEMTNWALSQACGIVGANAGYLGKLPAVLAADCLNLGMQTEKSEDLLIYSEHDGLHKAFTSQRYGRIFNADFAREIFNRLPGFTVPGVHGVPLERITKENTTLYASDRDCFLFLTDENNGIEMPNRRNGQPGTMFKGIYAWNSEVGSASAGIAGFLFDTVCGNRLVWGMEEYTERRIRHTTSVNERFVDDVLPLAAILAQRDMKPMQAKLLAAQDTKIEKMDEWLAKRYTPGKAKLYQAAFVADEGRPMESAFDVVTGITAYARTIEHSNSRIELEREAGKVLSMAA